MDPRADSFSIALALLALAGCAGTPKVAGVAGASPAPHVPWTPPASAIGDRVPARAAPTAVPADLASRIRQLTLAEVIDIGLRNNSTTRIAWANAQASAAALGSSRGEWLPTIDADVTGTQLQTVASQGRSAVEQSILSPAVTLSYLLLDFGGRSGRVAQAREGAVAAGFTHNAAIQDVVLEIEVAYFQYVANRALLDAQRTTVREAEENLAAAEERRRVGLATVADVLQARTAASSALLDAQTTEGQLQTARGALALALGLPANIPYDIDTAAGEAPIATLADSVEVLIDAAVRGRPDLAAIRADTEAARARVGEVRAARLPSLQVTANGARTYSRTIPGGGNSYNVQLGLNIPLFSGFSREYDQREAEFRWQAAAAQAEQLRQRVVFDVFRAYHDLQTATRRVRTADDLIASAEESSEVALARYRSGVGSVLDLLAAQSALAGARAGRIQARLAWSVSLAQLAHDAGILDTRGGSPLRLIPDTTTAPNR